jgi:predicted small secreted protein
MVYSILRKIFSLNWILFYHVLIENFEKFILYSICGLLIGIIITFIFYNIKKSSSNYLNVNNDTNKSDVTCSSSYYDNLSLKLRNNKKILKYRQNIPIIKYTDNNENRGIINLNRINY